MQIVIVILLLASLALGVVSLAAIGSVYKLLDMFIGEYVGITAAEHDAVIARIDSLAENIAEAVNDPAYLHRLERKSSHD